MLSVATVFFSHVASGEVYTWRELSGAVYPETSIRDPFHADAQVRGPRVVVTRGDTVIDDTGLPFRQRRQRQRSAPRR